MESYRKELIKDKEPKFIATAIMIKENEKPFSVDVVRGTKENVEKSLEHFKNTYKDSNIKIIDIN